MNDTKFQKRQTAYWAEIGDILGGTFIKNDESSSYLTKNGFSVSRVNVFGVVLSKDSNEFFEGIVLGDGSGTINVKSFEKKGMFEGIQIENVVNVIGKVREYEQSPFISVEIIVKSDKKAFELRKKELPSVQKFYKKEEIPKIAEEEVVVSDGGNHVFDLIRELDKGDGVDIGVISEKCKIKNLNEIIEGLVRNGDVFEIKPGKLKVLD